MVARVIGYHQDRSAPPRNFYDPHHFLADQPYELNPGEEILALVNGSGYKYNDDSIYKLEINDNSPPPPTLVPTCDQHHLCLLVRNQSVNHTIYVGQQTPLVWVLELSCITAQLCYCTFAHVKHFKTNLNSSSSSSKIIENKSILIQ